MSLSLSSKEEIVSALIDNEEVEESLETVYSRIGVSSARELFLLLSSRNRGCWSRCIWIFCFAFVIDVPVGFLSTAVLVVSSKGLE